MKNSIWSFSKPTQTSWKIFFLQTPKKYIFDFGIHKLPIFIKNSILKFKKPNQKKHIKNKHFWSVFLNWKFFEISIFENLGRDSSLDFQFFHSPIPTWNLKIFDVNTWRKLDWFFDFQKDLNRFWSKSWIGFSSQLWSKARFKSFGLISVLNCFQSLLRWLELVQFKILNWSQFSVLIKVLESVAESILIQIVIKFLNWFLSKSWIGFSSQFWSKFLNWLLNRFWSKGSLKSLNKNKFKILKSSVLSSDQKSWIGSYSDCDPKFWKDWVELILVQSFEKTELNRFSFSTLIKRFLFKMWFKGSLKSFWKDWVESILIQTSAQMTWIELLSKLLLKWLELISVQSSDQSLESVLFKDPCSQFWSKGSLKSFAQMTWINSAQIP